MSSISFDAVIFDMDGVITDTAAVHSAAWKAMFDEFLTERAAEAGEPFNEFRHTTDYLPYVDGKPRYKGVASFLQSRGIKLPYGDPEGPPGKDTVCGLGNRKNQLFNEMIAGGNVRVFGTTVALIEELREKGVRVGLASSSKNTQTVLRAAGLLDLFETRVDGIVSAELGLEGKPEPDIFTTACDNLGVTYDRAAVVEDAVSGVQAGARGGFGLVLGVAREGNEVELQTNGADIVVADMGEIGLKDLAEWFSQGIQDDNWSLSYHDYVQDQEAHRESLLTVGNGYLGTRGALEETRANGINYPGTYLAGVYNRLDSQVAGRTVSNEDMVNCPNWLPVMVRIGDGDWLDPNQDEIISLSRRLSFRDGVLGRSMVVRDAKGWETRIESSRLASMAQPHVAALSVEITPLNYTGQITIRSGLDGRVINAGVARYRQLSSRHLEPVIQGGNGQDCHLLVETNESRIRIAASARHSVKRGEEHVVVNPRLETEPGIAYTAFTLDASQGQAITIDKVVAIYTSRDKGASDPLAAAGEAAAQAGSFAQVRQASAKAWGEIWKKIDIQIEGDRQSQKLLRLNLYHLLVSASPHNANIDAGIPARGLHGEAYRGHIFWDELYILPFYDMHFPDAARSILLYRHRRLAQAKAIARAEGSQGAIFPWQSGSDGAEETQSLHLNPVSGKWGPDYSFLQRHVSLAIALNVWQYFQITRDTQFLESHGAELILEICRFWAGKAEFDPGTSRYHIAGVMGPDEYHEKPPGSEAGGLKDNAYSNIMAAWALGRALKVLAELSDPAVERLTQRMGLTADEVAGWRDIAGTISIPQSDDGVLEQFVGYFGLNELNWDAYREKYGNIGRMDRLLKAEGRSPDDYKVAKQADVLMAFFNLGQEGVAEILDSAGYLAGESLLRDNYCYYLPRTSHGSTLSRLVHGHLANWMGEEALSWRLYSEALASDYVDIQGGTTKEGIHTGVMAGTVLSALRSYAGLNLDGDEPSIAPHLPSSWRKVGFSVGFRGNRYSFVVTPHSVKVQVEKTAEGAPAVLVRGHRRVLPPEEWQTIELSEGEAKDAG